MYNYDFLNFLNNIHIDSYSMKNYVILNLESNEEAINVYGET